MNCAKFTRNQASNILIHCNRNDPNRTYGNQEIHPERTHLNYNLAPKHSGMTDFEFMKKRCEDLNIFKRNDVNWMVSWVITMPEDYKGNQRKFFEEAYNFMANRYQKENIISAYVHLDETSPHIHFCFVPAIFDEKTQKTKVNAKKLINKIELKKIHPEMQEYLENQLKTKVNILNGATKDGNKTIEQLKREEPIKRQAIKEIILNPTEEIRERVIEQMTTTQIDNIISEEENRIKQQLRDDEDFIYECKKSVKNEINQLTEEKEKLKEIISELQETKNSISESIFQLEIQHEEQKKRLKEEYEREKQRNNARIAEMQNITIEQEKNNPTFWDKISERIYKFKIVATISFVSYQFNKGVPIKNIIKNLKDFRKEYDFYNEHPEQVEEDIKYFNREGININQIENKEREEKQKDNYDYEI